MAAFKPAATSWPWETRYQPSLRSASFTAAPAASPNCVCRRCAVAACAVAKRGTARLLSNTGPVADEESLAAPTCAEARLISGMVAERADVAGVEAIEVEVEVDAPESAYTGPCIVRVPLSSTSSTQ